MASAEEAKKSGDEEFKSNNFDEAIKHWTIAIDLIKDDKEQLKKLYSNRSAAYHQLKNYSASLLDGEKCEKLDSGWAKGLTRKGDALFSLKRYIEAHNVTID